MRKRQGGGGPRGLMWWKVGKVRTGDREREPVSIKKWFENAKGRLKTLRGVLMISPNRVLRRFKLGLSVLLKRTGLQERQERRLETGTCMLRRPPDSPVRKSGKLLATG